MKCPVIFDVAIHKPLAFCTTYLREAAFSKLIIIKSRDIVGCECVGMVFLCSAFQALRTPL